MSPMKEIHNHVFLYAWVNNPMKQCPSFCDWPYVMATLGIGLDILVVKSPNNNEGINKMITIASLMVGVITNPFTNAYFQGDVANPLEID